MPSLAHLLTDESGQDLIEYALIAFLLALGAVASIKTLGDSINLFLTGVSITLTTAI
jgi:pilus assembly protein Flp/PilA